MSDTRHENDGKPFMNPHLEPLWQKILWRLAPHNENFARRRLLSGNLDLGSDTTPDVDVLTDWIDACLAEDGGQIAARERAATLGHGYRQLDAMGRARFLVLLVERYSADEDAIDAAADTWKKSLPEARRMAALALREALEPPRMRLLTQLNSVPEGVKFLVDMRVDVINLLPELPELKPLEADLKRLLTTWFDVGLLHVERITWQHNGAELLEKLMAYEAVHPVRDWKDLKNRLRGDRRCYALFHPNMPAEPLIFVQVALTRGLADNIQAILAEDTPALPEAEADSAIFFAISNAQRGLVGIHFGNYLIKSVAALLQRDLPHIRQFSTLSPIPGFHHWFTRQDPHDIVPQHCPDAVRELLQSPWDTLLPALQRLDDDEKRELLGLVAHYLVHEKRGTTLRARDAVAHFHLANGATVERLNWLADTSARGLVQSCGVMVNYVYDLRKARQRSQQYGREPDVPVSSHVRRLLRDRAQNQVR